MEEASETLLKRPTLNPGLSSNPYITPPKPTCNLGSEMLLEILSRVAADILPLQAEEQADSSMCLLFWISHSEFFQMEVLRIGGSSRV